MGAIAKSSSIPQNTITESNLHNNFKSKINIPAANTLYGKQNNNWTAISVKNAPSDGKTYVRKNGQWVEYSGQPQPIEHKMTVTYTPSITNVSAEGQTGTIKIEIDDFTQEQIKDAISGGLIQGLIKGDVWIDLFNLEYGIDKNTTTSSRTFEFTIEYNGDFTLSNTQSGTQAAAKEDITLNIIFTPSIEDVEPSGQNGTFIITGTGLTPEEIEAALWTDITLEHPTWIHIGIEDKTYRITSSGSDPRVGFVKLKYKDTVMQTIEVNQEADVSTELTITTDKTSKFNFTVGYIEKGSTDISHITTFYDASSSLIVTYRSTTEKVAIKSNAPGNAIIRHSKTQLADIPVDTKNWVYFNMIDYLYGPGDVAKTDMTIIIKEPQ